MTAEYYTSRRALTINAILRACAVVINAIGIIILAASHWTIYAFWLFVVVLAWSVIDLIEIPLLKGRGLPLLSAFFDAISMFILVIFGAVSIIASFAVDSRRVTHIVGSAICMVATIAHLVLFVRSVQHFMANRREKKLRRFDASYQQTTNPAYPTYA